MVDITAFDDNGVYKVDFEIPELDECPICHYALKPTILNSRYVMDSPDTGTPLCNLYTMFFCPKCRKVFLGKFRQAIELTYRRTADYMQAYELFPMTPSRESFTDNINKLSPTFVETYGQAQQAESERLSQICGIGYRKALEYLVKDYLCHKFPEDEETIKAELLSNSIRRIKDDRIQTLARCATWIGNDETHYVRKHEDLDIGTMKNFIRAMTHFINSELEFENALGIASA